MPEKPVPPPVVINIEAQTQQRDLIDQAAERMGLTRSDFVIEAACREAEDIVLDQNYFPLDDAAFARFEALLDNPPQPTDRLISLMVTKAPWE